MNSVKKNKKCGAYYRNLKIFKDMYNRFGSKQPNSSSTSTNNAVPVYRCDAVIGVFVLTYAILLLVLFYTGFYMFYCVYFIDNSIYLYRTSDDVASSENSCDAPEDLSERSINTHETGDNDDDDEDDAPFPDWVSEANESSDNDDGLSPGRIQSASGKFIYSFTHINYINYINLCTDLVLIFQALGNAVKEMIHCRMNYVNGRPSITYLSQH